MYVKISQLMLKLKLGMKLVNNITVEMLNLMLAIFNVQF